MHQQREATGTGVANLAAGGTARASADPGAEHPTIMVNGEPRPVAGALTVASVVERYAPCALGIAVARNREVVPRSQWEETVVVAGDRVEIVTAIAGGCS